MTTSTESGEPQVSIEDATRMVRDVVDEFRELLLSHLTDLHATTITTEHATIPVSKASQDPQRTAHLHRLAVACDQFINTLNRH
jgi:hypothetical protein